jgi:hypothetical protein
MIDWKAVDAAVYAAIFGVSLELASRAASPIFAAWVVFLCCILPFCFYAKGAIHNPSASKRIRGLNLFVGCAVTTLILEFGLPVWSLQTLALVSIGYVSTLAVTWRFSRYRGLSLKIPKRMFISTGWVLGTLFGIASFVFAALVSIGYDIGLQAVLTLPILSLFLVAAYPFGLLVVWISKVLRIAPRLYARRQYSKISGDSVGKSWRTRMMSRQEWNDVSLLTMGVDSGLRSRKLSVLLWLSVLAFFSLILTAHHISYYGWDVIALQGGLANLLLIGSEISYFKLNHTEIMNSPWKSR